MLKTLTLALVIPVYNEERYLEACLRSIVGQTVKPDEVIIVDNNSTDNSMSIVSQFPFARVIRQKKQGIVYARNAGFDAAGSDIIGRIDADTRLPADWVERVKAFYADGNHNDFALTGGGYFYNGRLPRVNGWITSQLVYRVNRFVLNHFITWGSNMALPRTAWQKIKKDICQRTDIHEDLDISIHLHQREYKITYDAALLVGVAFKRAWNDSLGRREHLRRWPNTLRVHSNRLWWMGHLGNIIILPIVGLFMLFELLARAIGRKALTHSNSKAK